MSKFITERYARNRRRSSDALWVAVNRLALVDSAAILQDCQEIRDSSAGVRSMVQGTTRLYQESRP